MNPRDDELPKLVEEAALRLSQRVGPRTQKTKTRAPNGAGRVYQRGRIWWVKVSINGKVRQVTSKSPDRAVAVALKNKLLANGEDGLSQVDCRRVTVDAILDNYLKTAAFRKRSSLESLRIFCMWATRYGLGGMRAAAVTTGSLVDIIQAMQRDGYADSSINRVVCTVHAAYNLAAKSTPPLVVKVPAFPPKLDETASIREGFLEPDEVDRVLSHLPDPAVRDFVEWLAWTGQRRGEVSKLTWSMVDLRAGTVEVPGRVTKNKKARKLALIPELRAILERRWEARKARMAQSLPCPDVVFWRVRAGEAVRMKDIRYGWRTACKLAGVPGRVVHDLRRSAVRNAFQATQNRRLAMLMSGHLTEAVFERYNIGTDADIKAGMEAVAALVRAKKAS